MSVFGVVFFIIFALPVAGTLLTLAFVARALRMDRVTPC